MDWRQNLTRGLVVLLVLLLGFVVAAEPISALDNFVGALREGDLEEARSFVVGPFDAIEEVTPVVQAFFTRVSREVRDVGIGMSGDRAFIYLDLSVVDSNYAWYYALGPLELRRHLGGEVDDDMAVAALVETMMSEDTPILTKTALLIVERDGDIWKIAADNEFFFKVLLDE